VIPLSVPGSIELNEKSERGERSERVRDNERVRENASAANDKESRRERVKALVSVVSGGGVTSLGVSKDRSLQPLQSNQQKSPNTLKYKRENEPYPVETTASQSEVRTTLNAIASDSQLSALFDSITLSDAVVQKLKTLDQTERCKNINQQARMVRQMLLDYHTDLAAEVLANDQRLEIEHHQQIQQSQDIYNQHQHDHSQLSYSGYSDNQYDDRASVVDKRSKPKSPRLHDANDPLSSSITPSSIRPTSSKRELADPSSAISVLQKQQAAAMRKKEHPDAQHYS